MTDPWGEANPPAVAPHCPWCSAKLKGDPARCPSCGASLHEEAPAEIPGVTALDPAAGVEARPTPRSRGLLGWLAGEYEAGEGVTEHDSVSPPTEAVRAEMARLEMQAIQAEMEAQAAELAATASELPGPEAATAEASERDAAEPGTPPA